DDDFGGATPVEPGERQAARRDQPAHPRRARGRPPAEHVGARAAHRDVGAGGHRAGPAPRAHRGHPGLPPRRRPGGARLPHRRVGARPPGPGAGEDGRADRGPPARGGRVPPHHRRGLPAHARPGPRRRRPRPRPPGLAGVRGDGHGGHQDHDRRAPEPAGRGPAGQL
ncbi:MAG: hypothetical protein AVDCRST_MAG54-2911, partial [uncultured Actinomycetospora sp.]